MSVLGPQVCLKQAYVMAAFPSARKRSAPFLVDGRTVAIPPLHCSQGAARGHTKAVATVALCPITLHPSTFLFIRTLAIFLPHVPAMCRTAADGTEVAICRSPQGVRCLPLPAGRTLVPPLRLSKANMARADHRSVGLGITPRS